MTIDWHDIQGNILRGYFFSRARFLSVEVLDAEAGRRWLGSTVVPRVVPPPAGGRQPPHVAVNVSFSHAGLAALGTDPAVLAAFPDEFREGMWARAAMLGDTRWERDWCAQPAAGVGDREAVAVGGADRPVTVHVLVAVHADDQDVIDRVAAAFAPASGEGVRLIAQADLAVLEPAGPVGDEGGVARREHFGFADGLSQPRIAGVNGPETAEPAPWYGRLLRAGGGSGGLWPRGRADPNPVIRLGEFVLGYPDEDDPHPVLPEPADLFRNGSYLVVRKLAQDVPAFWAFARAAATEARHDGRDDVTVADVAARVMGRARDGTPLVDPAVPAAGRDFSFRGDPEGRHCPLGSHVRRSNPRDGAALGASDVNRHRLLRRGLPYGPPSPAAAEVDVLDLTDHGQARLDAARDGVERGIFFLCFGASISRQFEFVQRSWLNDGDALGIGHSGDVVSGAEDREATVTVSDGRRMARPAAVVTARGGEYFFTPGIGALRLLSRSAHSRSGDDRGRGATVIDAVSTRGGS